MIIYLLRILILVVLILCGTSASADMIHEYQLKNGLKIIVAEDHRAPIILSSIWYRVGSSNEHSGITGLSHLLEHMMFTGSKQFTEEQITKLVSTSGGDQNAMTTTDYTMFFQQLTADKLPISFAIEADSMQNLLLKPEKFQRELKVVMEERRMRVDDNPEMLTFERFNAGAYINSPYHNPTAGWMTDVANLTLDDVSGWYKNWYGPNNAIILVVGDIKPDRVYQLVTQYFGAIPAIKLPEVKSRIQVPSMGLRVVNVNEPAKLPILFVGYNVPSLVTADSHADAYALALLSGVLSGGDSSRLQKNLVRGLGIASALGADYQLYQRYGGLFIVYGNPAPGRNVQELQTGILNEIQKIKTQPVTGEELQRAKTEIISSYFYQKDSLMSRAISLGVAEMSGLSWHADQNFVSEIQKVTPEQIQQVANTYLTPINQTIGILNPLPINPIKK